MNPKQNRFTIIATENVFNPDKVKQFDYFSFEHSMFLKSVLIENSIELFHNNFSEDGINILLNADDESFIPAYLTSDFIQIIYWQKLDQDFLSSLLEIYLSNNLSKVIFNSQSIGFTASDIAKAFNLLSAQDENIVLGKTENDFISLLAFCSIDAESLGELVSPIFNYEKFLIALNKNDHFINILSNFNLIKEFKNFNKLYHELAKKESEIYCSQKMHEKFTHLFIEYKALLK